MALLRLTYILCFLACAGPAISLKCKSCEMPCNEYSSEVVECKELCFTENYEGAVTKRCASLDESIRDREILISDGGGMVLEISRGKETCFCNLRDFCDCGIGMADVGSTWDLQQRTQWIDELSPLTKLTNKRDGIKGVAVFTRKHEPWKRTRWTHFKSKVTSTLDTILAVIKSKLWPTIKCSTCVAPCNKDSSQSINCKGYCLTEIRGEEVVLKDCVRVQSPIHTADGRVNYFSKSPDGEIWMNSTEDGTKKFYCKGGDYCNDKVGN